MKEDLVEKVLLSTYNNIVRLRHEGWDPYDFLHSKRCCIKRLNKRAILILTQISRISPINFRPILNIDRNQNSKAMALILHAMLIRDIFNKQEKKDKIECLKKWLLEERSDAYEEYSIGFTFDIILQNYGSRKGNPSLVITLFVMYALVEYYKWSADDKILETIVGFKSLIENKLPCEEDDQILWYSYNFEKVNEIYNATAKVGKFYSLLHEIIGDDQILLKIQKILNYLTVKQRNDGSWPYGEKIGYTDGFHTAFVLEAIWHMRQNVDSSRYEVLFDQGLEHYRRCLFKRHGQPLYFHPVYRPKDVRRYLIETDIRDCAMAIVLFAKTGDFERARDVLRWTLQHMYDQKRDYFYYYKNKLWTNRIEFIRWQAWMLYALSVLLHEEKNSIQ